jgi:hypothetical protein
MVIDCMSHSSFVLLHRGRGTRRTCDIVEIPNRGHALTIDSGWREVADKALAFIRRFV